MNVAENINKSCIIAFLLQNICINPLNVFRWKWEGFLIQGTLKWMIWHDGSCCFIHLIHLYNFIIMIYDITKTWIEEIWNVAFGVTNRKSPLWSRWYVIEWLFALSLSLSFHSVRSWPDRSSYSWLYSTYISLNVSSQWSHSQAYTYCLNITILHSHVIKCFCKFMYHLNFESQSCR